VLGALYQMIGGWLRDVLMIGSLIFVAVPFAKGDDYGLRVLAMLLLALAVLMALTLYYCWDGGWVAWWVKAFVFGLAAVVSSVADPIGGVECDENTRFVEAVRVVPAALNRIRDPREFTGHSAGDLDVHTGLLVLAGIQFPAVGHP
jgi:hypothetical protein